MMKKLTMVLVLQVIGLLAVPSMLFAGSADVYADGQKVVSEYAITNIAGSYFLRKDGVNTATADIGWGGFAITDIDDIVGDGSGSITNFLNIWATTDFYEGGVAIDTKYALQTITMSAGDGLGGGGSLAANRSFAVDGSVVRTNDTVYLAALTNSDITAGNAWSDAKVGRIWTLTYPTNNSAFTNDSLYLTEAASDLLYISRDGSTPPTATIDWGDQALTNIAYISNKLIVTNGLNTAAHTFSVWDSAGTENFWVSGEGQFGVGNTVIQHNQIGNTSGNLTIIAEDSVLLRTSTGNEDVKLQAGRYVTVEDRDDTYNTRVTFDTSTGETIWYDNAGAEFARVSTSGLNIKVADQKPQATITTDNTLLTAAHSTVLIDTSGGSVDIDLPEDSTCPNRIYTIMWTTAANAATITVNGSDTGFVGHGGGGGTYTFGSQYDAITIQNDGAGTWYIID